MLLERLGHEAVARGQRHRGDARARLVAAGGEQVGHQRLQDGEALGRDGALAAASGRLARALDERGRCGVRRGRALVRAGDAIEARRDLLDQLGRPERHGLAVEVEQPASEQARVGERRLEDERPVVLVGGDAVAARRALDEPGGGRRDADRGDLVGVAELPGGAVAPLRRVELGGIRKSRSRRVAKRTSPRMRESRNVRIASRSWSRPTRYHWPSRRNRL